MADLDTLRALPSSSTTLHTDDNEGKSRLAPSEPTSKEITTFAHDQLEKFFPKKGSVNPLPSTIAQDPNLKVELSTILGFDKLVEEISLKIWTLLRAHLKMIDQFQEDMERVYKAAIKAQVRSYLSWVGTALHVASIGAGVCSIGFTIMPGVSTGLCERAGQFLGFFPNGLPIDFAANATKALGTSQQIIGSGSQIHANYAAADRLSAQGTQEITKTRMEKNSRSSEEARSERNSVLQTLQQMYQQEAEARKAISVR